LGRGAAGAIWEDSEASRGPQTVGGWATNRFFLGKEDLRALGPGAFPPRRAALGPGGGAQSREPSPAGLGEVRRFHAFPPGAGPKLAAFFPFGFGGLLGGGGAGAVFGGGPRGTGNQNRSPVLPRFSFSKVQAYFWTGPPAEPDGAGNRFFFIFQGGAGDPGVPSDPPPQRGGADPRAPGGTNRAHRLVFQPPPGRGPGVRRKPQRQPARKGGKSRGGKKRKRRGKEKKKRKHSGPRDPGETLLGQRQPAIRGPPTSRWRSKFFGVFLALWWQETKAGKNTSTMGGPKPGGAREMIERARGPGRGGRVV